jgi:hypothetical protein
VCGTVQDVTENVEVASSLFPAPRVCSKNVHARSKVSLYFYPGLFCKILY